MFPVFNISKKLLPFLFLIGCAGQCLIRTDSFWFLVVVSPITTTLSSCKCYNPSSIQESTYLPYDLQCHFFLPCRHSIYFLGNGLKTDGFRVSSVFCFWLLFARSFIWLSSLQWMTVFVNFCSSFWSPSSYMLSHFMIVLIHQFCCIHFFPKSCIIKNKHVIEMCMPAHYRQFPQQKGYTVSLFIQEQVKSSWDITQWWRVIAGSNTYSFI